MIKFSFKLMSAAIIIIALSLGGCSKNQDDIELPIYDALGGDFTLPSTLGKSLTLSNYQGEIVLLNFGYTHCPDICPMILTRLVRLSAVLEKQYAVDNKKLQIIFVTVDPARDSVKLLSEYLDFFDSNFIGISASKPETEKLAKSYSVFFEKQPSEEMDYQMAHSGNIFLLDKRGRLRALYNNSDSDEKIIDDIVDLSNAKF